MIDCRISKRRRYDVQELQVAVAEQFKFWLAGKPPDQRIWPGRWWANASAMIQADLKAAGIEYETPEGVVDFHACGRVTFITHLVGTDTPLTLVMRIARLSTPTLLDRYYRPTDHDRVAVINKLPPLLPTS
jgi:hypothetical protein